MYVCMYVCIYIYIYIVFRKISEKLSTTLLGLEKREYHLISHNFCLARKTT